MSPQEKNNRSGPASPPELVNHGGMGQKIKERKKKNTARDGWSRFFATGLFSDPCNFPLIAIINFLSVSDHILSAGEPTAKLRDVRRNTLPIQLPVKPTDGHEPRTGDNTKSKEGENDSTLRFLLSLK